MLGTDDVPQTLTTLPRHGATKATQITEVFSAFAALAADEGEVAPETMVALDAAIAGDRAAADLLVGVPCTISIRGDRYAARVVRASSSLKTIEVEQVWLGIDGDFATATPARERTETFRLTKSGYYQPRTGQRLTVGHADEHWVWEV